MLVISLMILKRDSNSPSDLRILQRLTKKPFEINSRLRVSKISFSKLSESKPFRAPILTTNYSMSRVDRLLLASAVNICMIKLYKYF
jgi:hypothetical protein